MVNVERAGNYEISIRRWPAEYNQGINFHSNAKKALGAKKAYLEIDGISLEQDIPEDAVEVTFKVNLKAGPAALNTGFIAEGGKKAAAMYAYILNTDIFKGNEKGWQSRESLGLPMVNKSDLNHKDVPSICATLGKK